VPLYPRENSSSTLCRRPGGLQSRYELYGDEKNLFTLLGIEPRLLGCLTRSLVTIPTELSRLFIGYCNRKLLQIVRLSKILLSVIFFLDFVHVKITLNFVRFEVSTAVTMMIIIFWEMTPCDSYKNRRFGGSNRLHLQGARVRAGYRAKL
jgi:hypothetical protein